MTTDPFADLLSSRFGFAEFRTGQREAIDALMTHNAALAVFPTGGGKSLCYQLPALQIDGLTLVVSPLIALMKDQIDFLEKRGVPAARLDSTLTGDEVRSINDRVRRGEIRILYVAPERFNNERFLAELKRLQIGLFAIDEAHCISEWGHNFRPDYLKLAETAKEIGAHRVLTLTATATPSVVRDICKAFSIPEEAVILTGFYRRNLTMLTTPCVSTERSSRLVQRLRERAPGSTIVYVTLQKTAESLSIYLQKSGFAAEAYHAGMNPEERTRVQDWWMATPGGIVVATIAFGMGIDKSDVRYVYHFNLPKSLESYSQEVGRAGRDDIPSTVEMFASSADIPTLENFVYGDTPSDSSLKSLLSDLFQGPEEFALSTYEMSVRHDLRQLVLRTALTYLELLGALRRGTPFYAGYEFKPLCPLQGIESSFPSPHGSFALSLFRVAKKGRTWFTLEPEFVANELSVERKRVVRALDVMSEKGLIELRSSDVRDRYTRIADKSEINRLHQELSSRFQHREKQEIGRLAMVPDLVESDGCQVQALVGYFGQKLSGPCGHCSFCLTGQRQRIPVAESPKPISESLSATELRELQRGYLDELESPRQVARFLCGLTSPWFTKSKLSRHPFFGVLESHRFMDVVRWAERL